MATVLAPMFNEQYLLPWWLQHHKERFDRGILIDYDSTDASREICKAICPDWEVRTSANREFDAHAVDAEMMKIERELSGFRIVLNITEFLVGTVDLKKPQTLIPSIAFVDWEPQGTIDPSRPLWEQKKLGVHYRTDFGCRRARSFHDHPVAYPIGRHFAHFDTQSAIIFHYGHLISSPEMLARRLQIQHRCSAHDKARGLGMGHHNSGKGLTAADVEAWCKAAKTVDCSEDIKRLTGCP